MYLGKKRKMTTHCKSIGCTFTVMEGKDFCLDCINETSVTAANHIEENKTMAERYPQYYKRVDDLMEIDVYAVHNLFNIQDPSGAIQHASKKLLLSGVRTGGKSQFNDVREARDTLTRWLQLNLEKP
jgi:hypothetical protein